MFTRSELRIMHEAMLKLAYENMMSSEFGCTSARKIAGKYQADCLEICHKIEESVN